MKFIVFQDKLKLALNTVSRIITKHFSLPILENVLLQTEKGKLRLSTTNLEVGIHFWIPGKIEKQGAITVKANLLTNIVNNLTTDKITLEAVKSQLKINTKNYQAILKGQNAEEFPVIPKIKAQEFGSFNSSQIQKGLLQLANITTFSEARPEISGVFFRFFPEQIKLVATDSYRLGEKTIKTSYTPRQSSNKAIILPLKAVQELVRILDQAKEKFSISFDKNQVLFDFDGIQLTSRLIEGNFPDYEQIIPREFQTEAFVKRQDFLNQVKLMSLVSSRTNDLRFEFDPKANKIFFKAASVELGQSQSSMTAEIKGRPLEIVFNYRYILDGLNNISQGNIVFSLVEKSRPALIRGKGDRSYLYVVMPIKE